MQSGFSMYVEIRDTSQLSVHAIALLELIEYLEHNLDLISKYNVSGTSEVLL